MRITTLLLTTAKMLIADYCESASRYAAHISSMASSLK